MNTNATANLTIEDRVAASKTRIGYSMTTCNADQADYLRMRRNAECGNPIKQTVRAGRELVGPTNCNTRKWVLITIANKHRVPYATAKRVRNFILAREEAIRAVACHATNTLTTVNRSDVDYRVGRAGDYWMLSSGDEAVLRYVVRAHFGV